MVLARSDDEKSNVNCLQSREKHVSTECKKKK